MFKRVKSVQIGVPRMDFAHEEFATVYQGSQDKTVQKQFAQPPNTITLEHHLARLRVLQALTVTFTREHACLVKVEYVDNAETSPKFAQDVHHLRLPRYSINHSVSQHVQTPLTKTPIINV